MAVSSSISGAQLASQSGLQQLRLQQARRSAEQAERAAQSLSAQASAAQQVADRAQESARALSVQSDQAQVAAGRARQGLTAISSNQAAQAQLARVAAQTAERFFDTQSNKETPQQAPVVNTQGQVTGKLINTTA